MGGRGGGWLFHVWLQPRSACLTDFLYNFHSSVRAKTHNKAVARTHLKTNSLAALPSSMQQLKWEQRDGRLWGSIIVRRLWRLVEIKDPSLQTGGLSPAYRRISSSVKNRSTDRSVIDREETWHPSFSSAHSVKRCPTWLPGHTDGRDCRGRLRRISLGEGEPTQPETSDVADRRSQHVRMATGPHMSPFMYRCIPN